MIQKPLSFDHYSYLNRVLNLEPDEKLSQESAIKNTTFNKIREELKILEIKNTQQRDLLIEANILKMKHALETLENSSKRKMYNEGLALNSDPSNQITIKNNKGKDASIVPIAPINDILSEFNSFIDELVGQYKREGFKYEKIPGPPTLHVLTFPDEKSANAFIERLFGKNLAMFPGGSQDINDAKLDRQSYMKNELTGMRDDLNAKDTPGLRIKG